MHSLPIQFRNQNGEMLAARLDLPTHGKPRAYAIFAHCFTCTKEYNAPVHVSRVLQQQGIAVLRFDFTGLGRSEGDFSDSNFSSTLADLVAAGQYLEAHYAAPQLLIGHSLGGTAAVQASQQMPSVRAVVTLGSPASPQHVIHHLTQHIPQILARGSATVEIGGRPFQFKEQFLTDTEAVGSQPVMPGKGRALLVMHSPQDTVVDLGQAAQLYQQAQHPKSFITLDKADHLLSRKADAEYVGQLISSWAARYLHAELPEPLRTQEAVVARLRTGSMLTEVQAGEHTFLADEPLTNGGTGLGPTPYDLLLAALGACTTMTLRLYAERKGWPLEEVRVHLSHSRIAVGQERIERRLELIGPLTEEQQQRLLAIAEKCPVHRSLHAQMQVTTALLATA